MTTRNPAFARRFDRRLALRAPLILAVLTALTTGCVRVEPADVIVSVPPTAAPADLSASPASSGQLNGAVPASFFPGSGATATTPGAFAGPVPMPGYGWPAPVNAAPPTPGVDPSQSAATPVLKGPDGTTPAAGAPASGPLAFAAPSRGYPVTASVSPVSGYSASGYPVSGYPASGYPVSGYPVSGYPASGYPVSGYPVSGYPASTYPTTAYAAPGYAGTAPVAGSADPGPGSSPGSAVAGSTAPGAGATFTYSRTWRGRTSNFQIGWSANRS